MGLFLQKTNIIRDYLEDTVEGRAFWPRSVWEVSVKGGGLRIRVLSRPLPLYPLRVPVPSSFYYLNPCFALHLQLYSTVDTGGLAGLRTLAHGGGEGADRAAACLNHLVADALTLLPSCLHYLANVSTCPDVFRFCAIPQVRTNPHHTR